MNELKIILAAITILPISLLTGCMVGWICSWLLFTLDSSFFPTGSVTSVRSLGVLLFTIGAAAKHGFLLITIWEGIGFILGLDTINIVCNSSSNILRHFLPFFRMNPIDTETGRIDFIDCYWWFPLSCLSFFPLMIILYTIFKVEFLTGLFYFISWLILVAGFGIFLRKFMLWLKSDEDNSFSRVEASVTTSSRRSGLTKNQVIVGILCGLGLITFIAVIIKIPVAITLTVLGVGLTIVFNQSSS